MANERQWDAVPPVLLTADGTTEGVLQVIDTIGFFFDMQCTLQNNASTQLTVYIKRVVDKTTLWVGPKRGGLDHNVDISAFTVATVSNISAAMQNKSAVPMEARLLATYETDPIDAWRVRPVDPYGNSYSDSNPLPVAFDGTVSIGDVHILGPSPDNNELNVNADGSINVNIVETPVAGNLVRNIYSEANAVVGGVTTTLVQYVVPGSVTSSILYRVSVSGENIAKYTVFWNSTQIDTRRTYYGSSLSEYFEFTTGTNNGFTLSPGDTIVVKVIHERPYVGDFEGRIQLLEIT
jgi:hypothetical protein